VAKIPEQEKGRARDIVAKHFGVSGRYVQTAKSICEKLPDVADQIRKGNLTITQGKVQLKRQERVNAFKKAGKQFKSNHHLKIVHSDFYKWCNKNIDQNSIDLILTDPPYGQEHLPLYSQLGEVAQRVLKPSGWLITYCNVKFIPEITNTLSEYLTYWWMICLTYRGTVKMTFSTFNSFRPVLIYHKPPPRLPKLLNDHFPCKKREKDFHDYQQTEEPIAYMMERFSNVGDQILDPMAGAGTVIKVSKDLKRKCIAIDKNKKCVEIMRGRVR
jgi:DNA modification methylase